MVGKLFGVGVGPGDPELITVKAIRVLNCADLIAIPKTSLDKESVAFSIAKGVLTEEKEILELVFPMSFDEQVLSRSWDEAINLVRKRLDIGKNVAFVTLGDPTVYSTYLYVHKVLKREGYETEIIPGITSFCASAARAGISLGEKNDSIAIVPSAYDCAHLEGILNDFDNVILMKVSKNFEGIKEMIRSAGLADKCALVSNCGMKDEVITYDLEAFDGKNMSYFSTIIVKKSGVSNS